MVIKLSVCNCIYFQINCEVPANNEDRQSVSSWSGQVMIIKHFWEPLLDFLLLFSQLHTNLHIYGIQCNILLNMNNNQSRIIERHNIKYSSFLCVENSKLLSAILKCTTCCYQLQLPSHRILEIRIPFLYSNTGEHPISSFPSSPPSQPLVPLLHPVTPHDPFLQLLVRVRTLCVCPHVPTSHKVISTKFI